MHGARVLLIDNFDSFTFNVVHGLAEAGANVEVIRADAADLDAIEAARPTLLVISPGPGGPDDAVLSVDAVRRFAPRVPILGVCLGMQCIAVAFGGSIDRAPEPTHGKTSLVEHDGHGLFRGLPSPLRAARYHSLRVADVPGVFDVTARTADGIPMAIRHRDLPVVGVQFHPDSFLTERGSEMLANAVHGDL